MFSHGLRLAWPEAPPPTAPAPRPLPLALSSHGVAAGVARNPHRPSLALQLLTPVRLPFGR